MNALTIPRAVAGAEYTVIRLPLSVLETHVMERYLPEESPVRLGFERALGTLDATIGRVLSDPELNRRGAALARRSDQRHAGLVAGGFDAEDETEFGRIRHLSTPLPPRLFWP